MAEMGEISEEGLKEVKENISVGEEQFFYQGFYKNKKIK